MSKRFVTCTALLLCHVIAAGEALAETNFWQGKFEIYQLNFSFGTRTEGNKTRTHFKTLYNGLNLR